AASGHVQGGRPLRGRRSHGRRAQYREGQAEEDPDQGRPNEGRSHQGGRVTERDERDESRPKVRVVDKRRYRDGGPAEAEAAAQAGEPGGAGSPGGTVGMGSRPPRPVESAGGPDELIQARA